VRHSEFKKLVKVLWFGTQAPVYVSEYFREKKKMFRIGHHIEPKAAVVNKFPQPYFHHMHNNNQREQNHT
jgi:hypothetical protein